MPLLAWLTLVMSGWSDFAHPALGGADHAARRRYLGGHFYDTQAVVRGPLDAFFLDLRASGVYILVIPAFAFASEIHSGIFAPNRFSATR